MKIKMKTSTFVIVMAIAIVVAIYTLLPFLLVVINVFKNANGIVADPIGFTGASAGQLMTNLSSVVNNTNFSFWYAFGTSALITIVSLILLALFGGMAAWAICRNSKRKWSSIIYMMFIASMIIPFQVVMLPMISTFRDVGSFVGLPLLNSIPGIVFAYCGFGGAMTVFILTGMVKTVPYDLEEAATIDGCSYEGIYFRVVFPLLRPSVVTVTILNGMWIWNDYLLPSLVLSSKANRTIPLSTANFFGQFTIQWNLAMAGLTLTIIPVIIFYLCAQKYIIKGVAAGAVK